MNETNIEEKLRVVTLEAEAELAGILRLAKEEGWSSELAEAALLRWETKTGRRRLAVIGSR